MKKSGWLMLVLVLPSDGGSARVRFWRALKGMGCGVLRDGVYLLPGRPEHEAALNEQAEAIASAGGTAHLIRIDAAGPSQQEEFRALFDRGAAYAEFVGSLNSARKSLFRIRVAEINRLLRRLRREYESLKAADFFPGEAAAQAELAWAEFNSTVATVLSPDEPHASKRAIKRLDVKDFRGRLWATRRRLWVDRIASAWLIRRFIDPKARFLWLARPKDCPAEALGFDFDGATFTHVGERVTFEVLAASFGLGDDPGIARLGALVRALDVGGAAVPEADGFEAVLGGARERNSDDDRLLDEVGTVLDSLYIHFRKPAGRSKRP